MGYRIKHYNECLLVEIEECCCRFSQQFIVICVSALPACIPCDLQLIFDLISTGLFWWRRPSFLAAMHKSVSRCFLHVSCLSFNFSVSGQSQTRETHIHSGL